MNGKKLYMNRLIFAILILALWKWLFLQFARLTRAQPLQTREWRYSLDERMAIAHRTSQLSDFFEILCDVQCAQSPLPDYDLVWDWHHFTKVLGSCNWQDLNKLSVRTCALFPHIQFKWMARWTDLHNLLHDAGHDTALIQGFTHITLHVPRRWQTSLLCVTNFMVTQFMGKEVLNLQSLKGAVGLAMFLQVKERLNVPKRQQMDKCRKDVLGGMVRNVCQALSSWAGMSRHANSGTGNFCLLLWK